MEKEQESFKTLAKKAKMRVKKGFWQQCEENVNEKLKIAKDEGINESKAGAFLKEQVSASLSPVKEDAFYLKVKNLLETEGEVSDAIGRLTDKRYYESLTYEEKQRYTLEISSKYLRALERFKRENALKKLSFSNKA